MTQSGQRFGRCGPLEDSRQRDRRRAILRQGDFDITLPVTEMLEIIPSQPQREKLDVKIEKVEDGRIRVRGNFRKIPWKMAWYHKPEGAAADVADIRDVEPVLMLRKVAR